MLERDLYSAGLTEATVCLVCAARKTGVKA